MLRSLILLVTGLLLMTAQAATLQLRVLETTDLHVNIMDFDYYKDRPTDQYGLVRAATLIRQARNEVANSLLVDNGDLLQGSPMGDYAVSRAMESGWVHPVYKAMNRLGYDVANLGNHDFNYGLDYLRKALQGAEFPSISANVLDASTGDHAFAPYLIKPYRFADTAGNQQSLKVGFIGFLPPQIMRWDREHLEGVVTAHDIVETATRLVPKMRAEGADIVIALSHSGFNSEPHEPMAEQAANGLSQVQGLDAMVMGHAHKVFPGPVFENDAGVDLEHGTIHGVPAVMPGFWGNHIGVIDLTLENRSGRWHVVDSHSEARPLAGPDHKPLVEADSELVAALAEDHEGTRTFVGRPIGTACSEIYSYLALIQDDPSIQIVNEAQMAYVRRVFKDDEALKDLPILAVSAPFKAGGQRDPANYTEVEKGEMSFRNAVDLYPFPNSLVVLKITGAALKEWLECAAGQFNQIDPASGEPQMLINHRFPNHNFDVIDGVDYQIDVTQLARYDEHCRLINPQAERIQSLAWQGMAVDPEQQFLIAANNYRAYGGKFAGTGAESVVFASPEENRDILADYIERQTREQGVVRVIADHNWRLAPIMNPALDLRFETSPSAKGSRFVEAHARHAMTFLHENDDGFAVYRVAFH
ncbi:bifunctional 2',3'-cyclic-nucleotide 2'-phosphodiesterase/3'-nucleotidase [Kistimonas asteriae]|uniref:bifunctional 2',3'-cyclic-nucleotide 2'-phosphodiesterase/3'-nucleotidase n=1 Tax=Kistimonas asteriae TaxID=517724 RepID=UPI001BA4D874|nr:bifunctional 2',3'-cyclic-nucleotide 2'-phosphodiesterase/3'-nucleotidase [Kistimonas asteriae]